MSYRKIRPSIHRRFKVGERVAFITRSGVPVGRVGTVIAVVDRDGPFTVEWDGADYTRVKHLDYDALDLAYERELEEC